MVEEIGLEPVAEPSWLPVPAAARRLGISSQAVRKRIARGTLEAQRDVRGNRTRTVVRLPAAVAATVQEPERDAADNRDGTIDATVAELREHVARLEERLASAEAARERAERDNTDLRAERDRLLALVEVLAAEHRERRPWPGLRRWWRRFVEGEG